MVPHLASPDHPDTAAVTEATAHYDRLGQRYWALGDGQALNTDEGSQTIL